MSESTNEERLLKILQEVVPTLKQVLVQLAELAGQISGLNNGMAAMLQANTERDLLLEQVITNSKHQVEAVTGLGMAIHTYQLHVESTVDKLGKGVHLRVESTEQKVQRIEDWQKSHGGESSGTVFEEAKVQ